MSIDAVGPETPEVAAGARLPRALEALNRGLATPFRRGPRDFTTAGGLAAIRGDVAQVLGTVASGGASAGELPWRLEFGATVDRMRFLPAEAAGEVGRVYVIEALKRWVPQVRVLDVRIEPRSSVEDTTRFVVRYALTDRAGRVILPEDTVAVDA